VLQELEPPGDISKVEGKPLPALGASMTQQRFVAGEMM
jgi:hypothetical protein